eukprot:3951534-Pyramimonas_sp.AAC.1
MTCYRESQAASTLPCRGTTKKLWVSRCTWGIPRHRATEGKSRGSSLCIVSGPSGSFTGLGT